MSNTDLALFTQAGVPANIDAIKDRITKFKRETQSDNVQYLKIGQEGKPTEGLITFGADGNEVEPNSEWGVNVTGVVWGYLLRNGAQVDDEVWAPWYEDLPQVNEAKATGDKRWRRAIKAQMVCVTGEDAGVVVEFGGDTLGHQKFYRTLLDAYQAQLGADTDKLVPLITLAAGGYDNKKQAKHIYEIVPAIKSWVSDAELVALVSGNAE